MGIADYNVISEAGLACSVCVYRTNCVVSVDIR